MSFFLLVEFFFVFPSCKVFFIRKKNERRRKAFAFEFKVRISQYYFPFNSSNEMRKWKRKTKKRRMYGDDKRLKNMPHSFRGKKEKIIRK